MNFIFIMSDSFRFDNLACNTKRYPRFRAPKREVMTPHLDRFAERATIFERSYVGSYPTVQNRTDLFTGKMLPVNSWAPLGKDQTTFALALKKAGYWNQMIQDTPHTLKRGFHFDRDFDGWEWIRGQEGDNFGAEPVKEPGDPRKTRQNGAWGRHLGNIAVIRHCEQDYFCAQTMTRAVQWLERNYKKDKFFLYVDTFDPHEPWDAPQWYEDLYDPGYKGIAYRYPIYGKASTYTKAELAHMRASYAAEATLVDRWAGFLLESVERMGLMENTCVIFTADHGICIGDHGWTGKNAPPMYEEIARQPLLIHLPGQTASRRVKALVQPVDVSATILDLAGLKRPASFDGVSLKPALLGKPLKTRPYAFTRGNGAPSIASQDWSLVYPVRKEKSKSAAAPELFHLAADPAQTKDVLKKNLPRARKMWDAFAAWLAKADTDAAQVCSRP